MSATEPAAKKSRYLLTDWNPNDESKWDSKLAWRTLWITTYSLIPLSGASGDVFVYAGHAFITGLVAGAIGLGIALWRRGRVHHGGYRAALQFLAPVVPLWTWWVAVVDHMGRNASDYVLWLWTGGEAPSWPIEVTASLTNYGHGRGGILLLMMALAWVIDSRTLWGGGYVSALESDNYGNRWGPWRWRVWAGVPRNAFGRFLADGACLVSVVGPQQLEGTGITLVACRVEETRKCSASYQL